MQPGPAGAPPLTEAIEAWRACVGSSHVCVEPEALSRISTATFATTQRVIVIVRPANRLEVQACVRVADRLRVPIYPVSRGRNWGYGSAVPVADGSAVLDLRRMNAIVLYDSELGTVTVEPGVTFGQLADMLAQSGGRHVPNAPGSTEEASVLGNALERGHGRGEYADRAAFIAALEVVLPTGECVHTGFERFGSGALARTHRWGVGPALDGLFTQSNLGIVTRLTMHLAPCAAHSTRMSFIINEAAHFPRVVDLLRDLKLQGVLRNPVRFSNAYKDMAETMQYPWRAAGGHTPLPAPVLDGFRELRHGMLWRAKTAVDGATQGIVRELESAVLDTLLPHIAVAMLRDSTRSETLQGGTWRGGVLEPSAEPRRRSRRLLGFTSYWRKRMAIPKVLDPDRDRCGAIWFTPAAPFRGPDLVHLSGILESTTLEHGFEPQIASFGISPRSIDVSLALMYDRDVPGEDERALACHDALLAKSVRAGYLPYRLGLQSMGQLPRPQDDSPALMQRLKRALDPNDILAPGRYDLRQFWPDESPDQRTGGARGLRTK